MFNWHAMKKARPDHRAAIKKLGQTRMQKIRVAIAGVGNCASSLVQGIAFYRDRNEHGSAGLMHPRIGRWRCCDIEIVAAFDIDRRKVGKPL